MPSPGSDKLCYIAVRGAGGLNAGPASPYPPRVASRTGPNWPTFRLLLAPWVVHGDHACVGAACS